MIAEGYLGTGSILLIKGQPVDARKQFNAGLDLGSALQASLRQRLDSQSFYASRDAIRQMKLLSEDGRATGVVTGARALLAQSRLEEHEQLQTRFMLGKALAALGQYPIAKTELEAVTQNGRPRRDGYQIGLKALLALIALELEDRGDVSALVAQFQAYPVVPPSYQNELAELLKAYGLPAPPSIAEGSYGLPPGTVVGGGAGYRSILRQGDQIIRDQATLLDTLQRLQAEPPALHEQVVLFIPGDLTLDLSGEKQVVIPPRVTLASDRGHQGSKGALITQKRPDARNTDFLFQLSAGSRLTGLRLEGPSIPFSEISMMDKETFSRLIGRDAQSPLLSRFSAIQLIGSHAIVDNCEISHFNQGIRIDASCADVRANELHNIPWYPIAIYAARSSVIEENRFRWTWHAVATSFFPETSYVVRYNEFIEEAPNPYAQGHSLQIAVESHGMGDFFVVHHNTFRHENPELSVPNRSVAIMLPQGYCWITRNLILHTMTQQTALMDLKAKGQTRYTPSEGPRQLAVWRDIGFFHAEHFRQRAQSVDFREFALMTRGRGGGAGYLIWDNAFGPEQALLASSTFATPQIEILHPAFRRWQALPLHTHRFRKDTESLPWTLRLNPALPILSQPTALRFRVHPAPGREIKRVTVRLIPYETEGKLQLSPGITGALESWPNRKSSTILYQKGALPLVDEIMHNPASLNPGLYAVAIEILDQTGVEAGTMSFFNIQPLLEK